MPAFPPEIERWRSLVAQYFPPGEVDRALWVIMRESGGNPTIPSAFNAQGIEDSHGLWQINLNAHPQMRGKTNDPEAATAYAAQLWQQSGWQPWSATHKGFPAELAQSATGGGGRATMAPMNQNPGELPPGARIIGGNLATWVDPVDGTRYQFEYNPEPFYDPTTKRLVPAGWNPRGTPNEANPASRAQGAVTTAQLQEAGAQIGIGTATLNGEKYKQNADGTWTPSGTIETAASKGPLGAVTEAQLREAGAKFGVGVATHGGKEYRKNADGTYSVSGNVATAPEKPLSAAEKAALSFQRSQQILQGKSGDQLSQTATSSNEATSGAPAPVSRDPKLIYAPDSGFGQPGELAGLEMPTDINGSQGSRFYNPSQAVGSIFTAGLTPSGDKEKDLQTALGIDALRAQKLASGMSPEAVQREFDANISLGQRNAQADYATRFGMGGSTYDMGPSKGGVGFGAKTAPLSAGAYSSLLNPNQELSELDKLLLFGGGMANGGSVTAGVRGFASGGSIDVENQSAYYEDPSIGDTGAAMRRWDGNPWIFELAHSPSIAGSGAMMDWKGHNIGGFPALTRALQAAGAPPALIAAGVGGIMRLPPHMRERILGPMAREYLQDQISYQPAFSDPRSGLYQGSLIQMWNDVLEGNRGTQARGPAQRTPITVDEGGVYRQPGMGPVQRFQQPGTTEDFTAGQPQQGWDTGNGIGDPTIPRPVVTPPPAPEPVYTGPAQLPIDSHRELGISSVQEWPPKFRYGGEMTTQEPIVGMGAMSGQPQFVVGEAGPERLDVTPLTGPNAGNYAGGARMESGYEGMADYGATMHAPYKTRRPVPLLDPVMALRRMRTAA